MRQFRYAHRGLYDKAAGIPENSLSAFSRAVAYGFGVELDVLRDAADNMELVWDMDDTFMKQLSALGKRMLELGIIKKEPDYNALVDRRFVDALRQGK